MTTCKATQHSDQMMCPCGLAWDVNDPEPPTCKTTGQQARASGGPGSAMVAHDAQVEQEWTERRVAPRTSSLSAEAAHGRLSRLSALLRSSPVASASYSKIPTGGSPERDCTELLIEGEVVNVPIERYGKAISVPGRVVVCAAVVLLTNRGRVVIVGPRLFDPIMQAQIERCTLIPNDGRSMQEQGFIDQWGVFMSREEALIVAYNAGQLGRRPKVRPFYQLVSADLY